MKGLKVAHIPDQFYWYRNAVLKSYIFKCFCNRNCHNSPKSCKFCLKFWPVMTWYFRYATVFLEVLRDDQNWTKNWRFASFWEFCLRPLTSYELFPISNMTNATFKILIYGSNGTYTKFTVLVDFRTQFTARKPKIFLKIKISAKAASFRIANKLIPRS